MALKEYDIEIAGLPHTVQLDEEGAKRLGLAAKDVKSEKPAAKAKAAPKNKARTPRNKAAAPVADTASDPGASDE